MMDISISQLAADMRRAFKFTPDEIADFRQGDVPNGWTNVLMDVLAQEHDFEGQLIKEILRQESKS